MTIEAALKPSKKHKKLSEFGNRGQATEEGSQPSGRKRKTRPTESNESRATEVSTEAEASRPTKRRKKSLEGAIDSTEERKAISHWQQKSERDLEKSKKNVTETKKPKSVKKSVKFAEELVTSGGLPKNKSKTSILKVSSPSAKALNENSEVAKANEADGNGAETKVRKPKKSKNALKRIKWVKRHHKKTFSRRQRRANRELARSRPQRNAEQHLAEAVEYLNTWYSSPETWKYKKVAQLTLIKHAFNPVLIDEETFELLLHYLAGVQGAVVNRLRSMCQQLIDNGGKPPESPTFPLSIPCDCQDSHVVIERATKMLEFVLPPAAGI